MLTYQVRPRVLRTGGKEVKFPAEVTATFHLLPLQPFGMEKGGGRTVVRARGASIFFNANTGAHYAESKEPLKPIQVRIEEPARVITVEGNKLTVSELCDSAEHFDTFMNSVYFGLPLLLCVEFADPPIVERVDGVIGDVAFRWELADWQFQVDITTQEEQEERVATSWNRFNVISADRRRRLLGGLHYFHVACRLRREEKTPGEFLGAALLYLSKVLEVLFSSNRDAIRSALSRFNYSDTEIERDFIPRCFCEIRSTSVTQA